MQRSATIHQHNPRSSAHRDQVPTTTLSQTAKGAKSETAVDNLVSGIAIARSGDPGFYRVNPPLHKLYSGVAVDAAVHPSIPPLYPASSLMPGARQEFMLASDFLSANLTDYAASFIVGRLVRIPIMLLAAWLLLRGLPQSLGRPALFATVLWLTSPLALGHGWTIMPDAFSGAAMVLLIIATVTWLNSRVWLNFLWLGIAWGLAIGTKFTFCPLYLLWPIGVAGRLHGDLPAEKDLLHVIVVPSGSEAFVFDSTPGCLLLLEQA